MSHWDAIDWERLSHLRETFLSEKLGARTNYWSSVSDLESYDLTFGARIGWKWNTVLSEIKQRGWHPDASLPVVDWGCGTGRASRSYLEYFGGSGVSCIQLWDRSDLAMEFASQKLKSKQPELTIQKFKSCAEPFILLVSHVMNELDNSQYAFLVSLAEKASTVIWVEPGTYVISRKLIEVRERLRKEWQFWGPCPHREVCGLLDSKNESHWCHHFAKTPPFVFQEGHWKKFSDTLGIDLRSLPISFLCASKSGSPLPRDRRILGRPRHYKGYCKTIECRASGVAEKVLKQRDDPKLFKQLKKNFLTF